jgi:dihydroflavonol-4-reductase
MTVVVTGANGLVGANLVRALLEQHAPVRALIYEPNQALAGLPIETVAGDVRDRASLDRAFAGADVIYHFAALVSIAPRDDAAVGPVNVDGTRNVVRACLACGVRRLVHCSSIHAISPHPIDAIVDEGRPLVGSGEGMPYDRSKALAEGEVMAGVEAGLDATIVAPTAVLGPHDYRPSAMGRSLADFFRGRFRLLVDGGFDWIDARDVARAAVAAAVQGRCGRRYLVAGTWTTVRELADLAGEVSGVRVRRVELPLSVARPMAAAAAPVAYALGREARFTPRAIDALQYYRRVSYTRAAEELGYAPRPLRETIEAVYEWLRSRRAL